MENLFLIPPSRDKRKAPAWKKIFVASPIVFSGSLLCLKIN